MMPGRSTFNPLASILLPDQNEERVPAPSFPTRRSSDLRGGSWYPELTSRSDLTKRSQINPHSGKGRSEEHTSELQSPYELVCRLLLEKKKRLPATASAMNDWAGFPQQTRASTKGTTFGL